MTLGMTVQSWCLWYKRRGAGRLRRTLMRAWDPIGVDGIPEAHDEYDAYLGLVADRLRTGASTEEIARLLGSIRTSDMGLTSDKGADLGAAQATQAWYALEMELWAASH
jgi:hypothetical protein